VAVKLAGAPNTNSVPDPGVNPPIGIFGFGIVVDGVNENNGFFSSLFPSILTGRREPRGCI